MKPPGSIWSPFTSPYLLLGKRLSCLILLLKEFYFILGFLHLVKYQSYNPIFIITINISTVNVAKYLDFSKGLHPLMDINRSIFSDVHIVK